MKKTLLILVFVVIAILITLLVVKKNKNKKTNFRIVKVRMGEVTEKAIAIGQIVPRQDISIKSKIRGILKKKYVEVGDRVDIGTPLMEVNPDPTPIEYMQAKRKVEIAKVSMDNAETECKRSGQLHEKSWVSQQEFDDCKQAFDEASLRYEMARENFDLISKGTVKVEGNNVDNIIRSPIKGMILELLVDVGDPVVPLTTYQAGTALMTVADMTDLVFKGTVDEIDVGKIKEGIPAVITAGAMPDKKILGTISEISPKAKREANATLFKIEIELSDINTFGLRAGYSATANIIIASVTNAPVIPERLIFYSNDFAYVEVCKDEKLKIIKSQKIKTGLSDGMSTEIKNGLNEGDKIIERLKKTW